MLYGGAAEGSDMELPEIQGVTFMTLYARIVHELAMNPRIAQESLARHLDVTMRTVQRHLNELEREGYVKVLRDRKPYTYQIAWNRAIPYFGDLTVGIFRPDVLRELAQQGNNI